MLVDVCEDILILIYETCKISCHKFTNTVKFSELTTLQFSFPRSASSFYQFIFLCKSDIIIDISVINTDIKHLLLKNN